MLFINLILLLLKIDWNIILYVNIPDLLVYILNINLLFLFNRKEEKPQKIELIQKEEKKKKINSFELETNENLRKEWEKKLSDSKKIK